MLYHALYYLVYPIDHNIPIFTDRAMTLKSNITINYIYKTIKQDGIEFLESKKDEIMEVNKPLPKQKISVEKIVYEDSSKELDKIKDEIKNIGLNSINNMIHNNHPIKKHDNNNNKIFTKSQANAIIMEKYNNRNKLYHQSKPNNYIPIENKPIENKPIEYKPITTNNVDNGNYEKSITLKGGNELKLINQPKKHLPKEKIKENSFKENSFKEKPFKEKNVLSKLSMNITDKNNDDSDSDEIGRAHV